jgi:Domain of unknown function (DUF4185)
MTFVKPITGPGITDRVGMVSADLGIARWDAQRGANAVMDGDNVTEQFLRGEWQSPSIIMHDNDYNVLGIPTATGIASEGHRRQLWDYPHANPEYSTILPCDFIRVAGIWYVAAMVTAGLGNELRTVFWQSRNLVDWAKTEPYVALNHPGHRGNVMLTFDQIGDHVYIFGTGGLSRDQPVWMWRVKALDFPHIPWEPWGFDGRTWAWNVPNDNSPILGGHFGELCFRYLQGNCVLSFFDVDAYRQTALTVPNPTDDWTTAGRVDYAHGPDFPQLYGGYITPGSRLNEPDGMQFLVSQWNTQNNDPYHVCLFADTLTAQGPLIISPPAVEPEPEPPVVTVPPIPPLLADIPKDTTMTPTELYELLLRELSASGSQPITTPEGEHITLRQAVEQIFWKARGLHGLAPGRPRHPNLGDDQLGHVLNARAEGLFTQACVVALADQAGIDTAALYKQIQGSLK